MREKLPVFNLLHFQAFRGDLDFYAEDIPKHVNRHQFATKPHKHDFFMTVLFTQGSGTHEVDFSTYPITAGSIFLLSPGQSHCWNLSKDIDGVIFFHSRQFFDSGFSVLSLRDLPFFSSVYSRPLVQLKKTQLESTRALFGEILQEYRAEQTMKGQRLLALIGLLYTTLARSYSPKLRVKSEHYLAKLRQFEDLLDQHFRDIKSPSDYAALMSISERHLNRVTKTCLNKTPSDLVLDRNILEARRLLLHSDSAISEVGAGLGYADSSYFSRLFKKQTGTSPREFVNNYR